MKRVHAKEKPAPKQLACAFAFAGTRCTILSVLLAVCTPCGFLPSGCGPGSDPSQPTIRIAIHTVRERARYFEAPRALVPRNDESYDRVRQACRKGGRREAKRGTEVGDALPRASLTWKNACSSISPLPSRSKSCIRDRWDREAAVHAHRC